MSLKESKYSKCLYYSSNALSRKLTKMADDAFAPLGLAPSYAYLLMTVTDEPGVQPTQISKELQLTPSTVTRLVEKMESKGYLERSSEGRTIHVLPTDKCLELKGKLEQAWQQLQTNCAELLGDRYAEVLTEMTFKAAEML